MKHLIHITATLAMLAASHGAALTYEVTGTLSQSYNQSRWAVGTPFSVQFTYSTDTLQIAQIWQDFSAPIVVTSGWFAIGSERVLTFADQVIFYSDDPTGSFSFNLFLNIYVDQTSEPLNPTTDPLGYFQLSVASPSGFLADGRLFDETISEAISPFAYFNFDVREPLNFSGRGDVSFVRAIPEPYGQTVLVACFVLALLQRRRGACWGRSIFQ